MDQRNNSSFGGSQIIPIYIALLLDKASGYTCFYSLAFISCWDKLDTDKIYSLSNIPKHNTWPDRDGPKEHFFFWLKPNGTWSLVLYVDVAIKSYAISP